MVGFRAALLCGAGLTFVLLPARAAPAVAAEQHGKTVKQCNAELAANAAAIEAAGESPSTFFHTCWWHTAAGQKTPVEAPSKAAATDEKAPASATAKPATIAQPKRGETAAVPAHRATHERDTEHRLVRVRRHAPDDDEAAVPDHAEAPPVEPEAVPPPVQTAPARAPLVDSVHVTVVGVPNAVVLAVPAGVTPLVRELLNHPAVPGLTAVP